MTSTRTVSVESNGHILTVEVDMETEAAKILMDGKPVTESELEAATNFTSDVLVDEIVTRMAEE